MGTGAQLRTLRKIAASLVLLSLANIVVLMPTFAGEPVMVNQGPNWNDTERAEFYSLDQGSRLIPLKWLMGLKLPDGEPFMADNLRRYGFLPNPWSSENLPVGFTHAADFVGMTCAACHTRQIEVEGTTFRIDGGPAIIDFGGFLSDLNAAVGKAQNDEAAFAAFANAVLGPSNTPAAEATLRQEVGVWYSRFNTLITKGLPPNPWGLGRADATGMIFNRLTGFSLGLPPETNITFADAPVRYPFLWNAWKQDKTQWPGFAKNTDDNFRLLRNMGQVIGVFAEIHPKKDPSGGIDYCPASDDCSKYINFTSLKRLEKLTEKIQPPVWPLGQLDQPLVEKGKEIYGTAKCRDCHADTPGDPPWKTNISDVGSDSRALKLLDRKAQTGVLQGATLPQSTNGLEENDLALRILQVSVAGIYCKRNPVLCNLGAGSLQNHKAGYEARVLHGIWAAAPFLHNGSIPTLAELLKPPADRVASFRIGSAYDPVTVGLARDQTQFSFTLTTTDCSEVDSGNSRCGHDYGTDLSVEDKRALLEYLKQL